MWFGSGYQPGLGLGCGAGVCWGVGVVVVGGGVCVGVPALREARFALRSADACFSSICVVSWPVRNPSPSMESVPAGQSSLSVKTSAAVWMSVHDASGTRLMNATLAAGEEKTLNGKPPLKVRISNINKLTLSYNNQPVDLNTYKRGQRLSARFELK